MLNIMKLTLRIQRLLYFVIVILFQSSLAARADTTFPNEKEITFTSGDQSVRAFEGVIDVPENRNDIKSRLIPVHYVRFPATGKKKGSPIIYLSGGPGGSGIATAKYPNFRFPLFMALREHGDVIALDQRGTGKSKIAPKCLSNQFIPLNKRANEKTIRKTYRKAARECSVFWKEKGFDLLGYTTVQNALDIDLLRQHLKADKVTLWGISYGSHLALASIKVMPDHIDKIIIASAEGLDQTVKLPARTDVYFERLQAAINEQPKAVQAYPDIKVMMKRVHRQLQEAPISLKLPQEDGTPKEFLFQSFHMQGIASAMIADPQRGVGKLLTMYAALDNGVTNFLPKIIKRAGFDESQISFNLMSFGMDIASGISSRREKLVNIQSKSSLLGKYLNFPMPQLNQVIDGLDLGDDFRKFPQSDIPTLLLTGTLDGRTYIQAQKEATQGLTNLTHVMVNNAGHNLFMVSPKVTEVIHSFLRDKKLDTLEIEVELPPFIR